MNKERIVSAAQSNEVVLVPVRTTGDKFENAIREYGIVNACEWFGHAPDSEFTKETIKVLAERAAKAQEAASS